MKTSLFKRITSFIKEFAKPNSEVSSTRILALLLIPLMVIMFYVTLYKGISFDANATNIFLVMFCVIVCMAMGSVFLEHAIDRICRAIEIIKGGATNGSDTTDAKE